MSRALALIVDDEPDIRELLSITLARMGIDCVAAATLASARTALATRPFNLCLTDMRLPDGNGLDLVAHIQQQYPALPVAMITAHGSMESAIQALKSGAFDFVNKPIDLKALRKLVEQAVNLSQPLPQSSRDLIGQSKPIQRLRETIAKLARSQAPVLVSGESGTGKELVARLIHEQGARAAKAFVPVNCGAIPQELIESELFGHVKGSFTGAYSDKVGLFEAADGGTLFLDELGELPLAMQVKLLRAIQEKRIRRVGAAQESAVDCRVLSATNRDLAKLVATGSFRQDLYYRLNVIEVKVPALRERGEDLALLVRHFLLKFGRAVAGDALPLSPDAWAALQGYAFPGNVRELENVLERACTLCESGVIGVEDLQLPEAPTSRAFGELQEWLDHLERDRILAAIAQTGGNKTKAARVLGISFRALRYRLTRLGIASE
jgi:two-component system response regulator PilR (NtrC family)